MPGHSSQDRTAHRALIIRKSDLDAYNKKKYVWKLLYVHLLGYDVEFGHMEAVSLISQPNYSEKSVVSCSVTHRRYCFSLTVTATGICCHLAVDE